MKEKIHLDKSVYSLTAVKRALTNYTDVVFVKIKDENDIIVEIESKMENTNLKNLIKEIYNSALQEEVRYNIESETKNIRELLYEKAMKASNNF